MFHDFISNYRLQYLANYTCQTYWSIITHLIFFTLFVNRTYNQQWLVTTGCLYSIWLEYKAKIYLLTMLFKLQYNSNSKTEMSQNTLPVIPEMLQKYICTAHALAPLTLSTARCQQCTFAAAAGALIFVSMAGVEAAGTSPLASGWP